MSPWFRRMPAVVLGVVTSAVAGLAFARTFRFADVVLPVVVAAVAGAIAPMWFASSRRPPIAVAVFAGFGLWLLTLTWVGFGSVLPPIADVRTGVVDGWARILSSSVPTPTGGVYLTVPFTLTFVASAAVVALVLMSAARVALLVPPIILAATGLAFGPRESSPGPLLGILLAATSLGLLAAREAQFRSSATPRAMSGSGVRETLVAAAGPVLVGAAAVVVGALVVAAIPWADRQHSVGLRDHWTIGRGDQITRNPLDAVTRATGEGADDRVVFTVAIDRATSLAGKPLLFPVVVLDHFDGTGWTSRAASLVSGAHLPPGVPRRDTVDVRQRVTVDPTAAGDWLPALERPTQVDGIESEVYFDPDRGLLSSPGGRRKRSYDVVSSVTRAVPDPSTFAVGSVVVEQIPMLPELSKVSAAVFRPDVSQSRQLFDLAAFFNGTAPGPDGSKPFEFVDSGAEPGNSLLRLDQFVSTGDGSRRGSTEQFAAAFTLLARRSGLPVRLAVGYEVDPKLAAAGRTVKVTAASLRAWPEVDIAGMGWVPAVANALDPVPAASDAPAPPTTTTTTIAVDVDAAAQNPATTTIPIMKRPQPRRETGADPTPRSMVGWTVVLALAALALIGAAPLVKRLRRRRRRASGSPVDRVDGAWAEATDRLREIGVAPTSSRTVREVIEVATDRLGDDVNESLVPLGRAVNRARFADSEATDADAEDAWERADEFIGAVRASQSRRERLLADLDPRPLVRSR